MKIRAARRRDAASIAILHAASWRSAYRGLVPERRLGVGLDDDRRRRWRVLLAAMTARDVVLVADDGRRLLGFIAVWSDRIAPALIDNLHVMPDSRGQGIGERLLRAAARRLRARRIKRAFLWAFVANQAAVRFYERLGGLADRRSFKQFPPATPPCQRLVWLRLDPLCR
ncbi:MAG: GNAT family N-acetyltransferase [Alphaproteobacteria bacterium]|nr:GNAT family N-acetyltransferase [Alphaproteobacteria bacterium]